MRTLERFSNVVVIFWKITLVLVMASMIGFGVSFVVGVFRGLEVPWTAYFTAFTSMFATYQAANFADKWQKSKYYNPLRDDEHPEVQRAAIEQQRNSS